jgi:hypothetical protein
LLETALEKGGIPLLTVCLEKHAFNKAQNLFAIAGQLAVMFEQKANN